MIGHNQAMASSWHRAPDVGIYDGRFIRMLRIGLMMRIAPSALRGYNTAWNDPTNPFYPPNPDEPSVRVA